MLLAFMIVCGTAFFMKSIKASTPTLGIVLTKAIYIATLYTAHLIIFHQVHSRNPTDTIGN